jgi:MoaA/NifB/PqqE/SkfB family radical SAM enzyme
MIEGVPREGVVSWNINTACNYRCSYCTQRFKDDRGRWTVDTERFLRAFGRLEGRWEIKLSGGEPFVHPTLLEIVRGLASLGHRIGVVTNFSASRDKLLAFADAAEGRVSVVSCSLHREYVEDIHAFADKAAWFRSELLRLRVPDLPTPSLHVTTVATRSRLPELESLRDVFAARDLIFKVQPEKQQRDVIDYSPEERAELLRFGGHNLTGEIAPSFRGEPCLAGARYFILDDLGEAFRCWPARRRKTERLGNFLDETFRLFESARPCAYDYCNCSVPISRNMVRRSLEVLR